MNRIFLRAQVRELRGVDVAALVGQSHMNSVTAGDDSPFFLEMIVAHEGESRGELIGLGAKVKEWTRRVIKALVHAFDPSGRFPAKIFDGFEYWHDNESERTPVGEVVHSRVDSISGVSAAKTIGYIYKSQAVLRELIRNGERDICSIEADVVISSSNAGGGRVVVEDVERASAIVLGHSKKQTAGFPLARVFALQEFEPGEEEGEKGSKGEGEKAQPSLPVTQAFTKEEVQGWIKDALAASASATVSPSPLPATPSVTPPSPLPATPSVTPPLPPSPPEQPTETVKSAVDLTDPKYNEFLPV